MFMMMMMMMIYTVTVLEFASGSIDSGEVG